MVSRCSGGGDCVQPADSSGGASLSLIAFRQIHAERELSSVQLNLQIHQSVGIQDLKAVKVIKDNLINLS